MLTLTANQLHASIEPLRALQQEPLPVQTSLHVRRLIKRLDEEFRTIMEEAQGKSEDELRELGTTEITLEGFERVHVAALGDRASLSVADLDRLTWLFDGVDV